MKARLSLALLILAFAACERETPSDTTTVATGASASPAPQAVLRGRRMSKEIESQVAPAPPELAQIGMVAGGQAVDAASPDAVGTQRDPLQNVDGANSAPSMMIRTGQAFIEVEKIDPAVLRIRQLTAQVGGYITNSSMSGGRDQIRQATIEIKIPSGRYDQAVGSLSTIGKVETVNSTAQDVGEEFVDVTARVTNSRRLEERLLSLLANRTGKLDEVLRVERELARVREEIERYEGRLRYLSTRVALSTLTITVHEPAPILGSDPGSNPIAAALRRAWRNFVGLIAGIIASLGVLIPLSLIAAAGWFGYKRWKNRKAYPRS
jgi:hypothetical protein